MSLPNGCHLSPGQILPASIAPREEEYVVDLSHSFVCPDCRDNPPNLVEEVSAGDTVCGDCGRVLMQGNLDPGQEWRNFSNDNENGGEDKSRTGDAPNELFSSSQLATMIGVSTGAQGSNLTNSMLQRANQKANVNSNDAKLKQAYTQIQQWCEISKMDNTVATTTKLLYKKVVESKITQVNRATQDALMASCLFIACKQHDVHRSIKEITILSKLNKKQFNKSWKVVQTMLNEERNQVEFGVAAPKDNNIHGSSFKETSHTTAFDLLPRLCQKLDLGQTVVIKAQKIASKIDGRLPKQHAPHSVAGGCIFFVTREMDTPLPINELVSAASVGAGTMKAVCKEVEAAIALLPLDDDTSM
jgi:transcription initiation factor TFIIB